MVPLSSLFKERASFYDVICFNRGDSDASIHQISGRDMRRSASSWLIAANWNCQIIPYFYY
jgi:hypothetical protein